MGDSHPNGQHQTGVMLARGRSPKVRFGSETDIASQMWIEFYRRARQRDRLVKRRHPNFADYRVAQVFYSVGQPAKAIEIAKTQMRLDPFHPHFAPLIVGVAYYLLKDYREPQLWLRDATGRAPNHQYGHALLAAAYAQLEQLEDARAEAAEVLRINPKYTIGAQKAACTVHAAARLKASGMAITATPV